MENEGVSSVAEARDAYLSWNKAQKEHIGDVLTPELASHVMMLPLLFQMNNRALPGYIGADIPMGVYGYKPDKKTLAHASHINRKFHYSPEGVIRYPAIDAIYFQRNLLNKKIRCWIFCRDSLDRVQFNEVKEKTGNISKWYSAKGVPVEFIVTSEEKFRKKKVKQAGQDSKGVFLEQFYSESILLAGKYPVWWLVPPDEEASYDEYVKHIEEARFVDRAEYIDLGGLADISLEDYLQSALFQLQSIKEAADICLIRLIRICASVVSWPQQDTIAIRMKSILYAGEEQEKGVRLLCNLLHEYYAQFSKDDLILSPGRLFSGLKNLSGKLNHELIDAFVDNEYMHTANLKGIDNIISFMNVNKAVMHGIRKAYQTIVTSYTEHVNVSDQNDRLLTQASNMVSSLSESSGRIPLYNTRSVTDLILDRILLRHAFVNEIESRWSLVIKAADSSEKKVDGFESLTGLLAWCWLNRIVNHSTQVSIDCPGLQIRQVEARHILEVLMQQLDPADISNTPATAFKQPMMPLKSLLFINLNALSSPTNSPVNQVINSEQVVVNSWGDVYAHVYHSSTSLISCLCEWTHAAPLAGRRHPSEMFFSGIGTGDTTIIANRLSQIYGSMVDYFYVSKQVSGRFLLALDSDYYVVSAKEDLLYPQKLGNLNQMLDYLESPVAEFHGTELERLVYPDYPLKEIYQRNKDHVLQVYFYVANRVCYTWALDEKGSLFRDVHSVFERESYIVHWLYFFKNVADRLKKINYQERQLPTFEISQIAMNMLGEYEFSRVLPASITAEKNFNDLKIKIVGDDEGDQLSLWCDGKSYGYSDLKQGALTECVNDLKQQMSQSGRQPVYVTDIDVPLRLYGVSERDEIQISHILKFKRSFERQLNKLLSE